MRVSDVDFLKAFDLILQHLDFLILLCHHNVMIISHSDDLILQFFNGWFWCWIKSFLTSANGTTVLFLAASRLMM